MSTIKELIDRNKKRRKCQTKQDIFDLIESMMVTNDVLHEIQKVLQCHGIDTDKTPLIFYPEAIQNLLHKKVKEVGGLPGIPATVRYEVVVEEESDNEDVNRMRATFPPCYRQVEINNDNVHVGTDANETQHEPANDAGGQ